MTEDKPMTDEVLVLERVSNGVIVRPHRHYWREAAEGGYGPRTLDMREVRVFESEHSLQEAINTWYRETK